MDAATATLHVRVRGVAELAAATQSELDALAGNEHDDVHGAQRRLAELRASLRKASQTLQAIDVLVEDVQKPAEKQQLQLRLSLASSHIDNVSAQLRGLAVVLRGRSVRQAANNRNELLAGDNGVVRRQRRKSATDENILKTASEATSTLRRMTAMMSTEIGKGAQNLSSLDQQTKILHDTQKEYHGLGGVLQLSTQLISKLEYSQRVSNMLLFIAVLAFTVVVLYILNRRVFSWFLPT